MRVFVAGGAGVIGRRLMPQLVARGHQVTATTTSAVKLGLLEQLGAGGVVMDGLDAGSVKKAVASARPDAIVHQMTALSVVHDGRVSEEDPLPSEAGGPKMREMAEALRHVENVVVQAGGAALRYGAFYGPGANDDLVELVRKRRFPLVGGGTGYFNWVHLDDAASATVLALEQQAKGVFNIVDDEPVQVREWLPYLAETAGLRSEEHT